jgi:membrane protease YdiL (CAAX protease family)
MHIGEQIGDNEEDQNQVPSLPPIAPPPLLPIRIVRDGILMFVGSIVVTIAMVIVAVIGALVTGAIPAMQGENFTPSMGWIVGFLFVGELPFLGFGIYLRRRYRRKGHILQTLFGGKPASAIPIGIATGIGLAGVGTLHALLAMKVFGTASTQAMEEVMQTLFFQKGRPGGIAVLVFTIAVLAPLCEEFFFRGAIFSSVRSTKQAWAGALVSSVLFAIAHLNPTMITYYLIFGLTMCWLLAKTRTMAAPIAAHMTVNTVACIAVLLSPPAGK